MRNTRIAFGILFVLILFCCIPCNAQVATGTPPFSSPSGGPDTVDLGNLNVHITVPMLQKAGRGLPFFYNMSYDSSVWYPVGASGSQVWTPVPNWGWRAQTEVATGYLSYTVLIEVPQTQIVCNHLLPPPNCQTVIMGYNTTYSNFVYHDRLGVPHPFSGTATATENAAHGSPTNATLTAVTATDGSGFTVNFTGAPSGTSTATMADRAGRTFSVPTATGSGPGTITDTNGNEITINSSGKFFDTLNGTTQVLTVAGSGTSTSPKTYTYTPPSGTNVAYTMKFTSHTVETNFGCTGVTEYTGTQSLVSEIDLPDGTKYMFTYEQTPGHPTAVTGRLASYTLPTGGAVSYSYTGGSTGIVCADGSTSGLSRTTPDGTWTYARSGSGTAWTTTVTDPATPLPHNQTKIQFQSSTIVAGSPTSFYETERQIYQGSTSGTLLKTIYTCYNASASPCNSTAVSQPITKRSVTVQWPGTGGLESKTDTFYDSVYGLVKEVDEYGYGAGAVGSLLRKTFTTYASLSNGIVGKLATVIVKDASNTIKSQTTYSYDQGSVTVPITGTTPQHNSSITGSRGNVTTIAALVVGTTTTLNKTFTYYDTGVLNTSTDVNGAVTTYNLSSLATTCGNSFPDSVSEPLSLSRSMTWNCTGGVETSVTDENGNASSTTYNDTEFWRPNAVADAIPNVTNITYSGQTSVESSLVFNGAISTTDFLSTVDSLGRPQVSQRKQSPTATTYDSTETDYDSVGRPYRTTLPYGGTAGQTNSLAPGSITTYDALSRKLQIAGSGGQTVTYSYSQNDVYQTNGPAPTGENAKQRQFEYDAQGRLTSVCEITAGTTGWPGGSCAQTSAVTGYWTQYTYNLLNQVIGVTQNAQSTGSQQTRSYTYDLLGRMTSETNPESGTTTYTYDTDPTCGTFTGDLVKKVDAVGNITCYTHDAFHRVTSITVPSGSYASNTPNKYFVYDSATVNGVTMSNVEGLLAEAYTCTGSCTSKITDLGFSYSVRGEASDVYESTPNSGMYYHIGAAFWANGAISQLTNNLSTHLPTFTYGPNGEGRIQTISAGSGQSPVTGTIYNVAGLPTQVTLGSTDSDSYTYDPNTNRMTQYEFTVNSQSVVGTLTWNAIGTLETLAITDPFYGPGNETCSYTHDDETRIASVNCGSPWSQTFSYDTFGNLSKNGTISFLPTYSYLTNQMTGVGSSTPTYDANGNATNDTSQTYAWDAAGHAVTINSTGLTYDALGRMVEQSKGANFFQIVYTPMGAKFAIMKGSALTKAFVSLTGGGQAVYIGSGLSYYRHSDWLGSSRFASKPNQTMYSDGAYAPYGESYAQTGTADLSFTGMNNDTVTNLYDFPAREYNPIQGRWPSPDPAGLGSVDASNPQTFNRYAYVGNNPLSLTDPSGLCGEPDEPFTFPSAGVLGHPPCILGGAPGGGAGWPPMDPPKNPGGGGGGGTGTGTGTGNDPGPDPGKNIPPCSSLDLNDPSVFWNDSFATPDQVDAYFQQSNSPASWDGAETANAFIAQGMNPGLAVGIINAETSFCNNGCTTSGILGGTANNPFDSGIFVDTGNASTNFDVSLRQGLGTVVKLENATSSDNQPLTALYDQNNSLNQYYVAPDPGPNGSKTQEDWEDNVNSGFQNFANFLGDCSKK